MGKEEEQQRENMKSSQGKKRWPSRKQNKPYKELHNRNSQIGDAQLKEIN